MKIILRSGAVTAAVGVGLSLAVLPAVPATAAAGGTHVRCNDIAALKAAINNANTNGGRITLASRCTYTLTAADNADDGLPEITGNVTISGRDTTIRRASNATADFRILHVVSGGSLTLNSLTVSGGNPANGSDGGGIANENGTLNLHRTTIRGNQAEMGGGLYNTGGRLNLDHSTVERNTSTLWGGGVYNTGSGTLTMKGGALLKNRALDNGGGLENINGAANLHSVSVRGNTALQGGGIRQTLGATLRLTSSRVSDNIAVSGAGISNNNSTATLVRSLVTNNTAITTGGGIVNENTGQVTLTASRVIRNAPDNCAPAGSVPGCTNPTSTIAPPTAQLPPASGDTAPQ
ncbi:right-handed parallel beta-helix repeat-containing protein [Streptomyces albidus (ex Kaewkla and Franco 2022)]|uniref:right-handed parallel beta-helix repeat-containing protein n=1 Tax=Streptomyces albidus (ex Kaewkla and Franco 2022) TaxID=722709 RepID=UPI0015EF9053|nr:right-handed parallel beta-helix repeat-containing protein [Streptomyces albidus (ex Kaewkla and Franco 2022)]